MSKEKQEKYAYYAVLITGKLNELFEDETISSDELGDEDNIKAFLHAFTNVAPCYMYNKAMNDNKSHLEFNHIANALCFEFCHKED